MASEAAHLIEPPTVYRDLREARLDNLHSRCALRELNSLGRLVVLQALPLTVRVFAAHGAAHHADAGSFRPTIFFSTPWVIRKRARWLR